MEKAHLNREPKLGPPGAGLPLVQRLLARHYYFPRYTRSTSWEGATALFEKETGKIFKAILPFLDPLQEDKLTRRVLVKPMRGIEDSSRYWSIAMTLEHLTVVGVKIADGVVRLSKHQVPDFRVDVAAVKPAGSGTAGEALAEFRSFTESYVNRTQNEVQDRHSDAKLVHPWFGPLDAHAWHCLAAAHQNLHRKQIEAVIGGL